MRKSRSSHRASQILRSGWYRKVSAGKREVVRCVEGRGHARVGDKNVTQAFTHLFFEAWIECTAPHTACNEDFHYKLLSFPFSSEEVTRGLLPDMTQLDEEGKLDGFFGLLGGILFLVKLASLIQLGGSGNDDTDKTTNCML